MTAMMPLAVSSTVLMVLLAGGAMVLLALAFGLVLGWANVKFHVRQDPRIDDVLSALPGANCGGCGYVGCQAYAEAVVKGEVGADKCPVGGPSCAQAVADVLGIEVAESFPYRPVIHCAADYDDRLQRSDYRGEKTCFAANVIGGVQGCTYGCLGFGDCFKSCPYDAIAMVNGLPRILYNKCTGCGACERACPRHIISMIPFKADRMLVVACSNKDKGKLVKEVCKVGCLGCGACQRMNELFQVTDNISRLDYERYQPEQDFTEIINKCPAGAMVYIGQPSAKDLAKVAGEDMPAVAEDHFETTADKAQWRG